MPIFYDPKSTAAVVIGGVSVVCASVAAVSWLNNRRNLNFSQKNFKKQKNFVVDHFDETIATTSESNFTQTAMNLNRGGRINYRAMKKRQENLHKNDEEIIKNDSENRAAQLAAEFSSRMTMTQLDTHGQMDIETMTQTFNQGACKSEESSDSGKGESSSAHTPVNELFIEPPYMYEFEIPQNIVGLVIGRQGVTIKQFTEKSGAHIIIRQHHASENFKICTIEGQREQINICLRLIRRKFPPSRFPELKLTPIVPAPLLYNNVPPVIDAIIRLNLPEGVGCESTVCSLIDADHFFVHQPTQPSFTSLPRLDQHMIRVYSQPIGAPCLPRPIEEGVICATPVMDSWFRAQTVTMYEDTDEVLVKFVDYGGFWKIPANDLRQIRSDFMSLPFQAVECKLANVKPIDESVGWTPEAKNFAQQLTHGRLGEAFVRGATPNNIVVVDMCYLLPVNAEGAQESFSMSQLLIDNGHASWIEIPTQQQITVVEQQ